MDELPELVVETELAQGALSGLLVQIEQAALGAGVERRVELVDGRRDAVELKDAREDGTGQASSDDRDGG